MSYKTISFVLVLCIGVSIACQSVIEKEAEEQLYIIEGQVEKPLPDATAILSIFDPVTQVRSAIDTSVISEAGNYSLEYAFDGPNLYRVDFMKKQYVMLVVDEGQRLINLDVEGVSKGKASVKGSADAEKLMAYENFRLESNARLVSPTYQAMRDASKQDDHDAEIEAVENYAHASEAHRVELLDFTEKEIGTSIALFGSVLRWTGDEEIDRLDRLVQNFREVHPNLPMTKVMLDKVERFKKVALGATAPNIEAPDTLGAIKTINELKGKYTLIDFWASWCTPCLLQIPDLKEAYANYHEQGFEIIGVSVDTKEDRWKSSIISYEMAWPQVSDLKGWASVPAMNYNVTFIPFNVLVDKEGKIIAKNLHSKALNKKLESLLR